VIVSLCALSGAVHQGASEDPEETKRRRHFSQCASALAGILLPAHVSLAQAALGGVGEEAMMDGVRALGALAAIHATSDFMLPLEHGNPLNSKP
jgi:hypothetical protein